MAKKIAWGQLWVRIGIAGILLLVILSFGFYLGAVGKAVFIGEVERLASADLVEEQSVVLTKLPTTGEKIVKIIAPLQLYDPAPQEYTVVMAKREAGSYGIKILKEIETLAEDIIFTTDETDHSIIYLNEGDSNPDLEIIYQKVDPLLRQETLTITSLHFIRPAAAKVVFTNASGSLYPPIIRLNQSQELRGLINASSATTAPDLSVNVGQLTTVFPNRQRNFTSAKFNYTAPQGSRAEILEIKAKVGERETPAYYTLAIGQVVYAWQKEKHPLMLLAWNKETGKGQLNITFSATTELQPLALPCELTDANLGAFFGEAKVKVYSYDVTEATPISWAKDLPSDITALSTLKGYFVKLEEGQQLNVSTECTIKSLLPRLDIPPVAGDDLTYRLGRGWNLFSLPGTVPRPLSDFTAEENFRLFKCAQDYDCQEIMDLATPLYPGQPYWVQVNKEGGITLRYQWELLR